MSLTRAQSRQLAQGLAVARIALGLTAMTLPDLPLRLWLGRRGHDPAVRLVGRALGARDLALGMGALLSMRHDAPVRGWVEAGGMADAGDFGATLVGFSLLPRVGRWAVLAAAAGGAGAARLASVHVDD